MGMDILVHARDIPTKTDLAVYTRGLVMANPSPPSLSFLLRRLKTLSAISWPRSVYLRETVAVMRPLQIASVRYSKFSHSTGRSAELNIEGTLTSGARAEGTLPRWA